MFLLVAIGPSLRARMRYGWVVIGAVAHVAGCGHAATGVNSSYR